MASGGFLQGLHLSAESSEETISEAQRLSDEICQMLLAAGYFRARIPTLPAFDKMLGGLAWCITASNVDVEVDLLFDEEMTLGQKIRLGENVVAALRKMRCPCPLQTHQIRGLDFSALFPVFQWMVKQVIATRDEHAAKTRRFAEMKFRASHKLLEEVEEEKARLKAVPLLEAVKERFKAKRQFRRRGNRALAEEQHVACVLLEYGHSLPKGAGSLEGEGDEEQNQGAGLQEDLAALDGDADFLSGKRIGALVGMQSDAIQSLSAEYAQHASLYSTADPEAAARRGKEQAHKRVVASLSRQMQVAQHKVDARRSALESQMRIVEESETVLEQQRAALARVTAELQKLKAVETPENQKDIALLESLVSLNQRLEEQEETFRAHCKEQRKALVMRCKNFEDEGGGLPAEEYDRLLKVEALFASESERLSKLKGLLARKTQQCHVLKRKIDDVASRAELVQYERRFVELYEQIAANLEETRRYYTKYNTLTDTHKFLTKEISILNSISSKYSAVSASESQKAAFLVNLDTIQAGVKENLSRVQGKEKDETARREALSDQLNKVMCGQRGRGVEASAMGSTRRCHMVAGVKRGFLSYLFLPNLVAGISLPRAATHTLSRTRSLPASFPPSSPAPPFPAPTHQVLDKQRLYFKAVQTFQQECKRNEALRASVPQPQQPTPPAAPPVAPAPALADHVASAVPDL